MARGPTARCVSSHLQVVAVVKFNTHPETTGGKILGGEGQPGTWQSTEGPSWLLPHPINVSHFTLSQLFHCTSPSAEPTQLAAEQKDHGVSKPSAGVASCLSSSAENQPVFRKQKKTNTRKPKNSMQVTQWDSAQETSLVRPEELQTCHLCRDITCLRSWKWKRRWWETRVCQQRHRKIKWMKIWVRYSASD